ncbi:hypothetical protein IVB45_18595 [Bradyrhizobium sp. 4]|uniref:hypothetical protein n=1 Tax=unclassified Bradyrhizobium TaxID=2631580 RepID=UPI001FFA660E|nr:MULTISPECIES: hypothetical protein [unclassified Bradyrhizobium]MCK1400131.1 hypothetical protein [Bradyrhizobium sp. 39]MCK1750421.1 hypothetical protein [Bradyrhizobium sp. 135]UPJ32030.1 hypothetical protein IVB45_18595 [Bradyrhizobium sp. 4]
MTDGSNVLTADLADGLRPGKNDAGPFDSAVEYVTALEEEVKESPKAFYGNANLPADGHERVASALRAASSLKLRLEALVRGK